MFNRSLNGGSLFGNANTSTPTSTPTPASNTFQLPAKSGGLFGNASSGVNASSPSPAGSLFNNNNGNANGTNTTNAQNSRNQSVPTAATSLFGNNSGSGPSLFGNANKNPTSQNPTNSGSLFSRPANGQFNFGSNSTGATSKPSNGTNIFSGSNQTKPSSLFPNNTITSQPDALFGNTTSFALSSGNNGQTNGASSMNALSSANNNPYGLNIGGGPITVSNMPASITASLPTAKSNQDKITNPVSSASSCHRRKHSTSSSSSNFISENNALPVTSQSSLIQRLSTRLKTGQNVSSTQGIFSPFQKRPWMIDDQAGAGKINGSASLSGTSNGKGSVSMKEFSEFSLQKGDISEMRKLKIDPNRSSAKKLKLFSGKPVQTKVHEPEIRGHTDVDVVKTGNKTLNMGDSISKDEETLERSCSALLEDTKENEKSGVDELGYWSSPPPEQLAKLSFEQLAAVPSFVIGRKGYGYITFNYDVDLTAFAKNLKDELYGKVVKFHPTKTVEVYPDETSKAPIGCGLNVPATITLENIYPIDKKTRKTVKDATRYTEIQILIKKLKNMRNMEFISYNPFGGVWTFKVNHFSIWGLINEEDAEIGEDDIKKDKMDAFSKRTIVYPKQRRELAQSNKSQKDVVPGSFMNRTHVPTLENTTQNDLLKLQDKSHLDLNRDSAMWDEDPPIEEKPYEPDVNEVDFEGLEVEPSLNISNDWLEQLKLAGSNIRSIFVASKEIVRKDNDEIDMLFNEFNEGMQLEKKINREKRLKSSTFCHFSSDMSLLAKASNSSLGVKKLYLPSITQTKLDLFHMVFVKHIHLSSISERASNHYPKVGRNSLQFNDVATLCKNPDSKYWRLCSVLFDVVRLTYDVTNEGTRQCLLKKEKHKALCLWITEQVKDEIDTKIKVASNALDCIYLYLAKNDTISATKLAIKSQNGHLAILITLLGSNDARVRALASQQLNKWSSGGKQVDPRIARIYKLLTGDPAEKNFKINGCNEEFSWLALLGINIYYGKIDEHSLEQLIITHLSLFTPKVNDISFVILKLFGMQTSHEKFLQEIKTAAKVLDNTFLWYFIQILRFNNLGGFSNEINDRLTFNLIAELRIAQLHVEAIFAACFLTNDSVAQQQIDSIIYHEISNVTNFDHEETLKELKISHKLIYRSKALWDQYSKDFLSQARNLLKAGCFKEAENIIVNTVAPKLILTGNFSKSGEELQTLKKLLSQFPREQMENWDEGLGVFNNYLKLILDNQRDEKLFNSLIDGLLMIFEKHKHYSQIPVCCNIMSQKVASIFLETHNNIKGDLQNQRLLNLPLGQPEKAYLKNLLAGVQ